MRAIYFAAKTSIFRYWLLAAGFVSADVAVAQASLRITAGNPPVTVTETDPIAVNNYIVQAGVNAEGYAALTKGMIGMAVYSHGPQAIVVGELSERLFFHVGSYVDRSLTPVTFHIALTGQLGGGARVQSAFDFSHIVPSVWRDTQTIQTYSSTDVYPGGRVFADRGCVHNNIHNSLVASCTLMLLGEDPVVDISMTLSAIINNRYDGTYAFADYMHTSAVLLSVPDNVIWTSRSGVFLSDVDVQTGVPEPASWAMMIAGFGLVGSAARRREPRSGCG